MSSQIERLRLAAAAGNTDQVRALLDGGAKIEPDLEGRTALHLASANGHVSTVKALLDAGAKIDALDAAGYSPLHQAATEGHEEVVRLLLKSGCHVDTQDELHGNTALHEAAWKGFSRTVEILCKHGANFYIKNNGGFTPLHLTCQNGHNQCCRILLLSACKPDVRNSYGDTPLHTAARYGHAGVLRILISAFCNVNETNKNGDTALHIAAAMGKSKLTRILLEAGCDLKIKNNQGETARDIAERKEFKEVVKLMDNPPITLIPVLEQPKKHSKKREKDSNTSQESTTKEKKDKHKKSKKTHKVHFEYEKKSNTSPYGCHLYPDMSSFPQIKLKSLPQEPLKSGEQYYVDLAGNIKKGPRGLGYMCYCAPFFNHVEKKLDANKKELLDHIDSKNEDLKAKITHLEKRTHDQLFSLNQKMKESLAIERGECAERIDRRLFRERRELEQQQEHYARALQSEMRTLNQRCPNGISKNDATRKTVTNYPMHSGNWPLMRSKSEDLLSETNSNHNSTSMLSSTVTGMSHFTNNSSFMRPYMNPTQCGTKPKPMNGHIPNATKIRMRCFGYPELKRESRSEGDLTSCQTETTCYNSNASFIQGNRLPQVSHNVPQEDNKYIKNGYSAYSPHASQDHRSAKPENSTQHWRKEHSQNSQRNQYSHNPSSGLPLDSSNSQPNYVSMRTAPGVNHTHQGKYFMTENKNSNDVRPQANGLPLTQNREFCSSPTLKPQASRLDDRAAVLSVDNDGSSFV